MTTAQTWNKFFILILLVGSGFLIYLLSPMLTPFLIAALLAYLCNPLVLRLMKTGMSRGLAAITVLIAILLVIVILILLVTPLIEKQIAILLGLIPTISTWLEQNLSPLLENHLGVQLNGNLSDLVNLPKENLMQAGQGVFHTMVRSGKAVFETLLNLIFIPVITFYLLRDWDLIISKIHDLIPRRSVKTAERLASECDVVLSAFVRGQLLVMLALSIFYAVALTLLGLHAGIIIGIIIGIVSIVPYLGSIVGVLIAVISALVQFGTLSSFFWVLFIFALGHVLENVYLAPKLIGSRIGLHPVAVIFAILAGGVLFGITGVLLALPAAAVCVVLLRYWKECYTTSQLYKVKK